jgi:hypothetical protein
LAEYGVNHNHGGFKARLFHAYAYRAGLFPGISAGGRYRDAKGNRETSVVSLWPFANSSSAPIVDFIDMQRESLANLGLLAISGIGRALDNCRKILDDSRRIGPPVAFIRMLNETAFFDRATRFVRWIEGFERRRNVGGRRPSRGFEVSGIYGDVYETTVWIASTLPRKLGHGRNAGG